MTSVLEGTVGSRAHWAPARIGAITVALGTPMLLIIHSETLSIRMGLFFAVLVLTGLAMFQVVRALRAVERSESRLKHQVLHDALTGLPNRLHIERHLELAFGGASRATGVGLLFVDLDRFKLINDTLGHANGDALIIQVARRLQANVGPRDLVGRIGGDKFVVVLGDGVTVDHAREFANRLRQCLRSPITLDEIEFHVTASLGLAVAEERGNGKVVKALFRDAETAMYRAKEAGRDAVAVCEDSEVAQAAPGTELDRDLRHATRRGELHLVYQPIVEVADHRPIGIEALIRWAHPELGVLDPSKFIHLAEESGLIGEIGNWVLNEALRQLVICRSVPGMENLTVSVNVSTRQLQDDLLVQRIERMLANHDVLGTALCLEIAASEIAGVSETATSTLASLQRLGIKVAVDDFRIDASSVASLRRLPVDRVKIDPRFIDSPNLEGSDFRSSAAAFLTMARTRPFQTVAKGVETRGHARNILELGCDTAQG
ncbi:MAG TPA: EAL domain-containing protein, partial [Acidimicrobiales bacterium]|nr:EAL domain-containing protein [Acidimicrobiales bacterium]